jgi:uncharacterized protein (DUF2141 family)
MKKWLACMIMMVAVHKGAGAQNKVVADIANFENNKGVCRACLFNSAEAFEKSNPMACQIVPVSDKKAQAVFQNVPDGTYAIFVFHDTNNNGKMDTNFLGIPKEGYGASRNKLPFAAAPKFSANQFSISQQTALTLQIRLRNI